MRVAVYGLWHLGCVTAACLAEAGHRVTGMDRDDTVVGNLRRGQLPLFEPGLADLIAAGVASERLSFTGSPSEAFRDIDVLWVALDTPVDDRDQADVRWVRRSLEEVAAAIPPGTLVLISSQVPVGFTRALQRDWQDRRLRFAYLPENLRLGQALEAFRKPDRIVVGLDGAGDRPLIEALFPRTGPRFEWMSIESAEMTKHALNAFLATSVTFINELARLCEGLGADAKEVERGLKSEARIGPRAYLAPGAAFAGGTLARDLRYLVALGQQTGVATPLCAGVLAGNEVHGNWVRDRLGRLLAATLEPVVAILGLTYKPGTSTVRRSPALEHCAWLGAHGVAVRAHDPTVTERPDELPQDVALCATPEEALRGADVAVVATEWPAYRGLHGDTFARLMRRPRVIDPGHFLAPILASDPRITYVATGRAAA